MSKNKSKKKKRQARRRLGKIVSCVLTCVILVCTCIWIFAGKNDTRINAQPSDVEDKGLLRVNLKSIADCRALGLTLDGVYTVDGDAGFRFKRGTEIAVAEDGGDLYLSAGGLTVNMGSSFTLKRHAPDTGESAGGIYIHEALKDNLYAGDLKLTAEKQRITAVVTVQIEDYLYGVVGYEMSDSFPMEALKAQAIAARTYAMNAKNAKRDYDVVDTTLDQVYRGFNPEQKRVIKAVDETRGIVLGTDARSYGQCYFTASNGGQIASTRQIWGGTVSYIEMKADPYDLENAAAETRSALIPRKPDPDSELARALCGGIRIADAQEMRIDEIVAAELTDPDCEGSLMYRNVAFTVRVSKRTLEKRSVQPEPVQEAVTEEATLSEAEISETAGAGTALSETLPVGTPSQAEPDSPVPDEATPGEATPGEATPGEAEPAEEWVLSDWTEVEETFVVKLSTYNCLKSALKIGINSASYETFSLEEGTEGFTLTARRFGHGVGMSQRGAQTMAKDYDKNCEEILAFYYPGLTLYEIDWQQNDLTPISALPESLGYARARPTPRPTQAPLPPLKDGEYYATVTLQSSASTLNVRSEPNTGCAIVAYLYQGEKVIVTGAYPDGWVSIKTVEFEGYVKSDYLKK